MRWFGTHHAAEMSTSGDGSNITTAKRRRGRTAGSKNKPKFHVASSTPNPGILHTHVLQIPAGGDVAETFAAFARGSSTFGVCILSASGPIAAAVLWESSPFSSTLTFQGSFDLLSMTATFLPGAGNQGSLAMTLAGPQGQVVGGVVAGPVVAAGMVIVVAATFASPSIHHFDAINNTSDSMGNILPAKGMKTGQVDGPPMFVEGSGAENWERGMLAEYVDQLEEHLDLRPTVEGVLTGASIVGGERGGEEVDKNVLEDYFKELEQCLELPSIASGSVEKDINRASKNSGSCCELFVFDALRVSATFPFLY